MPTSCRPAARWRWTGTAFPPRSPRRWKTIRASRIAREEIDGAAAGRLALGHHRHRPPHLACARRQPSRAPTGEEHLAFFDAIAPIVHRESIDFDIAWFQSRYDKEGPGGGGADYINLPMDEAQYRAFVAALLAGEKTDFKEWEKSTPYFEACLPIEVMAARGEETLRFGPMKPVGLCDPRTGSRPYAVVQLRQDNALGTLWNMVGFQTKLKHGEQTRIFRTIPGLGECASSRGWAACIATPSSIRRACWTRSCG